MNDETKQEIEDLSTLACSTDEVLRKRALVALLGRVVGRAGQVDHEYNADAFIDGQLRAVEQERDTHKANAETLARDLGEARAAVDCLTARLPLETVLQCLGGVLNDMTRGGDFEKAEAQSFHDSACVRLRSLAGSPENKAARVLSADEARDVARKMWSTYEYADGNEADGAEAILRWLERAGYLSVRLPPEA